MTAVPQTRPLLVLGSRVSVRTKAGWYPGRVVARSYGSTGATRYVITLDTGANLTCPASDVVPDFLGGASCSAL